MSIFVYRHLDHYVKSKQGKDLPMEENENHSPRSLC